MSKTNDLSNVVHRISFTLEEDLIINQRAYVAGITPAAYIRQQTLRGVVQSIDWEALRVHTELLSDMAAQLFLHLSVLPALDRDMHAAVLDAIARDLKSILAFEQDVFHFIIPVIPDSDV